MPQGLRDLKRRIRSVQTTQKVTQAMKMVAAAKLRRAQEAAERSRPYNEAISAALETVSSSSGHVDHPLLKAQPGTRRAMLVITSDRGLCGPYNALVLRKAVADLGPNPQQHLIVPVGRKGRDFFARRAYELAASFAPVGDDPGFALAKAIGEEVTRLYVSGTVSQVDLAYAEFVTAVSQKQVVRRILPLGQPENKTDHGVAPFYLYEPSAEDVLAELLPRYLETLILSALLEAKASEHGARMAAMDSATRNSDEMIRHLTLLHNRARQAAITQEIAEIVGGAEAL